MIGVWANPIVVILGAILGTFLRGGIPERIRRTIMHGLGLCVTLIGISGAISTANVLIVILSIVAGAILGEALRIEDRLNSFGAWAQRKVARPGDTTFGQGFVSAMLLFCIGSMAVVGSMEAGLSNDADTLLAKSAIDGITAVLFASTMGIGVALSSVPLLLYQGGIALLSKLIGPCLSAEVINEMGAAGSLLILGLGLNMLGCPKEDIKIGNLLPAIFMPVLFCPLIDLITSLF